MYEAHYKLRALPFALTPDPGFLYGSKQHRHALTMLRYGVESRSGFCLLTGEVGSGKTMLVRSLLASVRDEVIVGLINNMTRHVGRVLQWVSVAYGLEHKGRDDAELYEGFVDYLLREYGLGRRVVLVVDEAQNLSVDMLEQLRVLSNVNADRHVMLQTVLVGQPELRDTLRLQQLRQLTQRISIDYHLEALGPADTRAYVQHRLRVVGGDSTLISAEAIELVHQASGGVPRLINQLCDTALVHGFAEQLQRIDAALMEQAIASRMGGGLFPGHGVAGRQTANAAAPAD